ncbi:MAG: hypothetical protein IPK76_12280 [Lewinellaceae bacterium]|nr:hypothetical protein [Lewinellaceae bacterium]
MLKKYLLPAFICVFGFSACKKEGPADASLQFQFRFDPSQVRLNNIGQPAAIPAGHAAQTPVFHEMSVHYIELAPNALTLLGQGAVVYKAAETTKGGDNAVDFDKAARSGEGTVFQTISLKNVPPGTYEWVRASVTYQNYEVTFNINHVPLAGDLKGQKGRVASFVGFNTYLNSVTPKSKTLAVNDDKKQGFWVFETELSAPYSAYNNLYSGEAPAGATTVVNPLFATSPIPQGSCVVTGKFAQPLVVTGAETQDITVTLSFSIQNSLEWQDDNANGQLDFYADQTPFEKIVDMGLRGLIPEWK